MELKFIWIKKYRNLNDFGVNFNHSGKHKFNFANGKLNLEPNPKQLITFSENISGITVIAGENGSGKSSICEIVLESTATFVNGALSYNIKFDGIVCYDNYIFYHENISIANVIELKRKRYKLQKFKETPFEKMNQEWRDAFIKGGFVYYSNVIDWRSLIQGMNLANISTQSLISEDHLRTDYGFYSNFNTNLFQAERNNKSGLNSMLGFHQTEQFRNVNYYLNYANSIPVAPPSEFILESTYSENNRYLNYKNGKEYDVYKDYSELERDLFNSIHVITVDDEYEKDCKSDFDKLRENKDYLYRFNILVAEIIEKKKFPEIEDARGFIYENKNLKSLFEKHVEVNEILKIHQNLLKQGTFYEQYNPLSLKIHYGDQIDWRLMVISPMSIKNTEQNRSDLKRFIELENTIINKNNNSLKRISNYRMLPQLSSGENSYYSLFARLFETINRYDAGFDNRDTLILFIDEGEVGFHPAWKKKYLNWIVEFLSSSFSNYKFQLILTTHSPYLLSDLPSENVRLLRKGIRGKAEIVPSENYSSFGSNIHTLLSDGFFLKDGTIGEFAKNRIQEVIQYLNLFIKDGKTIAQKSYAKHKWLNKHENVLEFIGMIGDNILRNKLLEMYNSVFNSDADINKEIAFLREKIKALKKKKAK